MNYEEFKKYVTDNIIDFLPEKYSDATAEIHKVTKNNNLTLDGLIVKLPDINITPTIYLNDYYDSISNNPTPTQAENALGKIADSVERYQVHTNINNIQFFEWEKIKDSIIFEMVNVPRNINMLENCPHFLENDLAGIYKIYVPINDEYGTILLDNEKLSFIEKKNNMKISADSLKSLSMVNTERLLPVEIKNMSEILNELMPGFEDDIPELPMYIVTNDVKNKGAASLFYPGTLDKIADILGTEQYYVIPSSIHETIVLPSNGNEMTPNEIEEMIHEVNMTEVSQEEFLSDNAYKYDSKTKVLEFAGNGHEKFKKHMTDRIIRNCKAAGVHPNLKMINNIEKLQHNTKSLINVKHLDNLQHNKAFMQIDANKKLLKSTIQDMQKLSIINQR